MPRATQSAGSSVVDFFRKAPLELADFVLGLCKDALKERHQKSADAKARATEATAPVKAKAKAKTKAAKTAKVAKVRAKSAGVKKSHHKKVAKPAAAAAFPTPGSDADVVGPVVPAPELAGASV